jgi:hypothetical protein
VNDLVEYETRLNFILPKYKDPARSITASAMLMARKPPPGARCTSGVMASRECLELCTCAF